VGRWALGAMLALAVMAAGCAPAAAPPREREVAPNPPAAPFRPVAFPRDDAPHDNLTEWWYYTGHLFDEAGGRYGFEFVIFQVIRGDYPVAYVAHMAVTDGPRARFWHDQRGDLRPPQTVSERLELDVGGWRLQGAQGDDTITARGTEYGLDLRFTSTKPPVLHDGIGWFDFGPVGSSYYYSRTRLAAEGTLYLGDEARTVRGQAWMDHQWGDYLVVGGWDWYSLQLDDATELMLFFTRAPDGTPGITFGTFVAADGATRDLDASEFEVVATGSWTSPHTGGVYPSGWQVTVPAVGLALELTPTLLDQELQTAATTGLAYWEGQVEVRGTRDGAPLAGLGYVELTGYAPTQARTAAASSAMAVSASAGVP
jgi:predicted secreted hydrolase